MREGLCVSMCMYACERLSLDRHISHRSGSCSAVQVVLRRVEGHQNGQLVLLDLHLDLFDNMVFDMPFGSAHARIPPLQTSCPYPHRPPSGTIGTGQMGILKVECDYTSTNQIVGV